jgi:thymidylate synthase
MIAFGANDMFTISCRNVNDGYYRILNLIAAKGVIEESRNGKVKVLPAPLLVEVRQPRERVLFDRARDANPIFHLLEACWMLAGARDVAFVSQFNGNMVNFSDDKSIFNAAYGHRWRHHFGYDQIVRAVEMLQANPKDRRVVISMWDPAGDLGSDSLDIPCNQQIFPRIVNGRLEFTTTNRSNDMVWGLFGANFVHLTFLQEWMAGALGVPVGQWYHLANNAHIYEPHWKLLDTPKDFTYIWSKWPGAQPLLSPGEDAALFRAECVQLVGGKLDGFQSRFLEDTVEPVYASWREWKGGDKEEAIEIAKSIESNDWRRAVISWYNRRLK